MSGELYLGRTGIENFIKLYESIGEQDKADKLKEYLKEFDKQRGSLMKYVPDGFFTYNPYTGEVEYHKI